MPDRQDFEAISSDTVVDPIPNAIKMETLDLRRTRLVDTNSDVRPHKQKIQRGLQILAYSTWSCRSIDRPPPDNTFNLASGASRNEELKRHPYP
jgi:hypothetical protein